MFSSSFMVKAFSVMFFFQKRREKGDALILVVDINIYVRTVLGILKGTNSLSVNWHIKINHMAGILGVRTCPFACMLVDPT